MAGPENTTATEFAERFFKDIQSRDRKDVTNPRRYLENDILPAIGGKPVKNITAEDVRVIIWRKKEQGFDAAAGQIRGLLKRMFDYALNQALKVSLQGQEIPAFTTHDLRRTTSTLLHEQGWPSDVVEKALNHTIGGVRGIYNRAEYAEQRKKMLQAWADYIDGLAPSENLVVGAILA
ncbi:MAG: site-specific integrase [Pseudomonadales bacterium]|jgi:integrase|nr:site-specific integrase [Pseudomonadales bacterium]